MLYVVPHSLALFATFANVLAFLLCWLHFILYALILIRIRAPNAISSIRMAISHQLSGHNNKKKMLLWLVVFTILLIHKWMSIPVMRFHFLRFHMLVLSPPILWIRFWNLCQTGNRRNTPRNSQIKEIYWNGTWQNPWKEKKMTLMWARLALFIFKRQSVCNFFENDTNNEKIQKNYFIEISCDIISDFVISVHSFNSDVTQTASEWNAQFFHRFNFDM